MKDSDSKNKSLVAFFTLTILLSTPFYVLNALAYLHVLGKPEMGAFYIALFTITPLASASILTFRSQGMKGVKKLLRTIFDFKRITRKRWYLVIVLLPPLLFLAAISCIALLGLSMPPASMPFIALPVLIPFFFLLAAGEEVGWMGYAFNTLDIRLGSLRAALVLGIIWACWHLPFFIFMIPHPWVLFAQLIALVGNRILLVWIYKNTGQSVAACILFHALENVALLTFPEINSIIPWGAVIYCGLIWIAALIVISLWGTRTLARDRFT